MNATETLTMADLVAGRWTADEDLAYEGYAHATRNWNGWRVCYFTPEVMERIVEDVSTFDADWYLSIEVVDGVEVVQEFAPDGEVIPFASLVTVDGVTLWDATDSGWTWVEASNG